MYIYIYKIKYKNNTGRGFCYRHFIITGSIGEYFIQLNIVLFLL